MAGHYYTIAGKPMHHVPNKSGTGIRRTTITDVRSRGLLVSPTTVLDVLRKPALEIWKERELYKAMEGLPDEAKALYQEDFNAWQARIKQSLEEQMSVAPGFGTKLHKGIELYLMWLKSDKKLDVNIEDDIQPWITVFAKWWKKLGAEIIQLEDVLVCPEEGYAGTVDAIISIKNKTYIMDFKSQRWKWKARGKKWECRAYDTWPVQMAAYSYAYDKDLSKPMINVCIDSNEPGRIETFKWDDGRYYFDLFLKARDLWAYVNEYDPRQLSE